MVPGLVFMIPGEFYRHWWFQVGLNPRGRWEHPKRYPLDLYLGPIIPPARPSDDDDDDNEDKYDDDDAWQARREYVEVQTEWQVGLSWVTVSGRGRE